MSNAELIYVTVVLLVGIPAMLKNWTAVALVASYLFMQVSYYAFALVYPPVVSFLTDCTVIMLILCKEPACNLAPYKDWRAQLHGCWMERSFWDRIILGLFPVGWMFYALARDPWWPLYWVSLAQLLAAGYEALETFHIARSAKRASAPEPPPSGLSFTPEWGIRPWVT